MRLFTPIGARGESNFTRKACRVSNGVNAGVEGRHKPGAKWALERQALSNVTYASVLRTKAIGAEEVYTTKPECRRRPVWV